MSERLQKVLANLGLGSRRTMEDWIREGRISVNGKVAALGTTVDGSEKILVDGQPIKLDDSPFVRRIIAYNKPVGEVTTRNDPDGRRTVFDSLPPIKNGRWISIGRLDINTQGLLLLTNDGELANKMMHPSSEIEREYAVRVLGTLTEEMVTNMKNGVEFEDGLSKFDDILYSGGEGANIWYHVILKGGKNREVRRLWESQGLTVSRLIRVRYGSFTLPKSLRAGHSIDLEIDDTKALLEDAGMQFRMENFYVAPENKRGAYRAKPNRKFAPDRPMGDRKSRGERNDRSARTDRSDRAPRTERNERSSRPSFGDAKRFDGAKRSDSSRSARPARASNQSNNRRYDRD
ncbi:23S rRNA pseudouridine(2605) synthase RluB [Wohlfahrtiimonas chitiniclastica]|uniref:23S rRNA pseudouridine(2605) synthase RluB n=1 Tax=Wohlfahrtiimonas chitiniclastica TaxID=400946 RepID=UPI000B98B62A|nr:pseudouridine synthase [Wohlfahrtiimonas chitiniclastica]OYQ74705.1 23S rRNA pseudouridylate synthase B [Wohlfahrtiimonas chitiniclastica]